MINKIVLLADIHFRPYKRKHEFRAVCEAFIAHMKDAKPDRIVIAGDIVHLRNQVSPELVNEVSWFLRCCAEVTEKLIIIPGNHDVVEQNLSRMDAIHPIIKALNLPNIEFYVKSELYPDENVVWSVFSIYENNAMPIDLLSKPYGLDKTYIGLYHGLVLGAKNDLGYEFVHGAEPKTFDLTDITLCGDIHKRQVLLSVPSKKAIIFPGSFIQQDFAETISSHGYCTINISKKEKITYEFTDLDNPVKYYNFLINDIEDIYEEQEILKNA